MLGEHCLLLASTSDSHRQPILYFNDRFNRPIHVWFPSIYKRAVQTQCQKKLLPSLKNRLVCFVDFIGSLWLIVIIQKRMEKLF